MSTTPGYVSNSDLAQRLSKVVDRWNTRENQMISLLTQEEGTVVVTDGLGVNHTLPSFPQLQKEVKGMTNELTGSVAQVREIATLVTGLSVDARNSANDAADSAEEAAATADSIRDIETTTTSHRDAAAASAAAAETSAGRSSVSATNAASSAGQAATSATAAAGSATAANTSKTAAATSATNANTAKTGAETARTAAQTAQTAAEAALASARTVLGDTTDVADLVEADAAAAAASATAAAGSASTAATQATNAKNSATTASTKAGEASGSATTAANHASAASGSAAAASTSAQTASSAKTAAESARDKANLYANAPAGTEVSTGEFSAKHWAAQAQAAATGSLIYMGSWDASTGKYPANPVKGHFYKVIGEGTISGIHWRVGDQALYGVSWEKIDNTDQVSSVAGKQGDVTLVAGDIGGLGVLATRNDVDFNTQVTGKPATYPASTHTHTKAQVGLDKVDNTADLAKPVSTATQAALDAKANTSHTHTIANVTNLQTELDSKVLLTSSADWQSGVKDIAVYRSGVNQNGLPSAYSLAVSLPSPDSATGIALGAYYGAQQKFYLRSRHDTKDNTAAGRWKDWVEVWHSANFNPASKADSAHTHAVADLSDTTISSPANGQVLKYDSTSGKWTNQADANSTYSVVSSAELQAGTATTGRLLSASVLKGWGDWRLGGYVKTADAQTLTPNAGGLLPLVSGGDIDAVTTSTAALYNQSPTGGPNTGDATVLTWKYQSGTGLQLLSNHGTANKLFYRTCATTTNAPWRELATLEGANTWAGKQHYSAGFSVGNDQIIDLGAGAVVRSPSTGSLVIAAGEESIYLRPGGNTATAAQAVLKPDGSFTAAQFVGPLQGTATSANSAATLTTARTINGTSFNGSANVTTANWGTARNLTIGSTAKSVNGSANVAWTLAEIGAAAVSHSHAIGDVSGLQAALDAKAGTAGATFSGQVVLANASPIRLTGMGAAGAVYLHGTNGAGDDIASISRNNANSSYNLQWNGAAHVTSRLTVGDQIYLNGGWFRSQQSGTGWYHEAHGGGWMMQDNTYIRTYGGKRVLIAGGGGSEGDLRLESYSPTIAFYDTDNGTSHWLHCNDNNHGFLASNAFAWCAYRDGNNNWVATGNIVAYASDARLKKNIVDASAAKVTDFFDRFRVREFDWNPDAIAELNPTFNPASDHEIGGIAQEAEDVYSLMVATHANGIKTIQWEKAVPLLIAEVQALRKRLAVVEGGA